MNIFDFSLDYVSAAMADLNTLWLCCGPHPERIFAGAWLLAPYSRVLAVLPHSDVTTFNRHQHKTYLRLWFIETHNDAHVPLKNLPSPLIVRVALLRQPTSDLFLMVPGLMRSSDSGSSTVNSEKATPRWLNAPRRNTADETWHLCPPLNPRRHLHHQQQQQQQNDNNRTGAGATNANRTPLGPPRPPLLAAPPMRTTTNFNQPPAPNQPPPPELLLKRILEKQEEVAAAAASASTVNMYDPDNPYL